ncbi:endoglucanase [Cupriavidus gilardii J11]|uniref:cellulase n=1 Tax=Cupriavidus gilardii J11 TaxID=936133 RepID=A0A562BNQ3_9BURK|nr:endoglucanase [Cupriavidus gilardii J11]
MVGGFALVGLWRGVVAGLREWPLPHALAAILLSLTSLTAAATCAWPDWEAFKRDTVSADGRVIDASTPQQATVSEGQAYALFFALVANDRPAFDRLLQWTETNLAGGDLTARLPAWIWGRRDAAGASAPGASQWGVIDSNPASDADLWIAYTLLEAGRLWQERRFTAIGTVMARQILRTETAVLPGLGRTVLPGPVGFHPQPDLWRLNPSYVPPQVMRRLAAVLPALDAGQSEWPQLVDTSIRLLADTAPHGFAPDWVRYRASRGAGRFLPDEETQAESAYNAIRVYLWIGMLNRDDPARQRLLRTYQPMADYTVAQGRPPERVDTRSGAIQSRHGNAGFSAAVAPYLAALGRDDAARAQVRRVRELAASEPLGYYSQVLALFGLGYLDGLYRFEADGAVTPAWTETCPAVR